LFQARAAIPDAAEFPDLKPYLPSYGFPEHVLGEGRLARSLAPERIAAVRRALEHVNRAQSGVSIAYRAPWADKGVIQHDSVDMLFSQAVLEHVDDLETTYTAAAAWLKRGGFVSHEIAFDSHLLTPEWNGHWTIPDPVWTLIRGRRPYLLNREPASTHLRLLGRSGLSLVGEVRVHARSGVERRRLSGRFRALSDDDLSTRAMFVQAVKPA
jgi:hypothetical protein